MKKMTILLLTAIIITLSMTSASAIRMESNGNTWFLPDGRMVQTKRVLTNNGSEFPGLLCYDQSGELLWEHTFRTPALGRSFCQLTDENIIAFMYYDQNHQYFIEYFDHDGRFVAKTTRELSTTGGALYDGGAVFCVKQPHRVLIIRHWDGREKRWEFEGAEKLTLYSVQSYGNNVYIELCIQNSQKNVYSILCIDNREDVIRWAYHLDSEPPVKAYAGNEQGSITLYIQKNAPDDQYEMEMLTLDSYGNEVSRAQVDGIPATMAINVISEQEMGIYTIWGYGYDTYGENKVICAKVNAQGKVVERNDFPTEYATCVRYVNDEIYVMNYRDGLDSYELLPFAEFADQ